MPDFDDEEDMEWEEDDEDEEEEETDEDESDLDELIAEAEDLVETGQAKKAIKLWKRSLDRFSDDPQAYYYLGWACFRFLEDELGGRDSLSGDPELLPYYEEGVSSLEESVAMEPENPKAWNLIAQLYVLRGKKKPAIEALEKSLEFDDSQTDIQDLLDELRS